MNVYRIYRKIERMIDSLDHSKYVPGIKNYIELYKRYLINTGVENARELWLPLESKLKRTDFY